jgi:predicted Zn-dependent protease
MKKLFFILFLALGTHAANSGAFDFGKILQQPSEPKKQKKDQAAEQPAGQTDSNPNLLALFGKTSIEEETRIGRQVAGDLLGVAPLVKDDTLQKYVNTVGRWVASQSNRPELNWHFGVIESDDINAFSAPGGFVFVTKGLYKRLNNEAELAGVLAHEIAHVSKKHHLELLKKTQMISALTQTVGKEIKGSDQAVQNLIGNGAEMMARSLDKEAEFEADRVGVVYAARSGYDAWGLPTVYRTWPPSTPRMTDWRCCTKPTRQRLTAWHDWVMP